ncbi:MAG: amidohydrolase [Bacteroidia bacterium]|nr:amidohydrolase [Bacteroidia bacterium]
MKRPTTTRLSKAPWILLLSSFLLLDISCGPSQTTTSEADLIIHNAKIYTLSWEDPDENGTPAADAPFTDGRWNPDAEAIVIKGDKLIYIGNKESALEYKGDKTQIIDAEGNILIPGLIDSHTHPFGFGANLGKVDLTNLKDKELIVQTLKEESDPNIKKGDWILGFGYDEGNLSTEALPNADLLSTHFPDNPVYLLGAHGFSSVANRMAMELVGINSDSEAPVGGEIVKDAQGNLMGIFLNNASGMLADALPAKSLEDYKKIGLYGLNVMAKSGFTSIHDAGMGRTNYESYQALEDEGNLPIRVYGMIRATDTSLVNQLKQQGPDQDMEEMFVVRSLKAYYDGSLGIRGARMIEDYSDKAGHKGVSGEAYGYDEALVAEMMNLGYQTGIHAIGDAGNREVLNFYNRVYEKHPNARKNRNRIEHAQVVHPDDFDRFKSLDLIASMEPPHMAEDLDWAEDRVGRERIKGAYAWRTMREKGVPLTFNSDLTGSDHSIFYGLYAAIARKNRDKKPDGGWYIEQKMSPEEALRAYTIWAAYAGFQEKEIGSLEVGKMADITMLNIDVLNLGLTDPDKLWDGKILMTMVGGKIVYEGM